MKKIVLILCAFAPIFLYADDCSNAYKAGLDLYKKGKYIEAQSKFIAVATECGDYSEVFNMLRACNKNIAEQQTQLVANHDKQEKQISSLVNENKKLKDKQAIEAPVTSSPGSGQKLVDAFNAQKNTIESLQSELQTANGTITTLQNELQVANNDITSLRSELQKSNDNLRTQQAALDSISKVPSKTRTTNKNDILSLKKKIKELKKQLKLTKKELRLAKKEKRKQKRNKQK